jgi:hypothetical protein
MIQSRLVPPLADWRARLRCLGENVGRSHRTASAIENEDGTDALPFEPPEQENIRLRDENARLRLLTVHSIPIPQLAPENPPPTKTVETAAQVDKEDRARKRIALFRSLFRGREDVYARL